MSESPVSDPKDPGTALDSVFTAQIGKIVAFALAPLLALAVPPVVDGLNTVLGTDFSNQEISNIAIATVVGVALVIWQWLRNRGNWEKMLGEAKLLYDSGAAVTPLPPPVSSAPPVSAPVVSSAPGDPVPSSSALGMNEPE